MKNKRYVLRINNTPSTGRLANNRKSKKFLSQTLPGIGKTTISKFVEKIYLDKDSFGN